MMVASRIPDEFLVIGGAQGTEAAIEVVQVRIRVFPSHDLDARHGREILGDRELAGGRMA
jgi:hypothetical protein